MKDTKFRFKQFSVSHEVSSMKVGVDGVMLATWANVDGCLSILDAGCGCGVIALICAQRTRHALITAIDTHLPSVREANHNFLLSPWYIRLIALHVDFADYATSEKADLIISNPPYFDSGVEEAETARMQARHELGFGPYAILHRAKELLRYSGRIAMIFPTDRLEDILAKAAEEGFSAIRICTVYGRAGKESKRVMVEFGRAEVYIEEPIREELTIELSPGVYSPEYLALGRDFYLKF